MSGELETRVIEVTQQDIDEGKRIDCHFCPVALAFKRQLVDTVRADVLGISVFIGPPINRYPLPENVRSWIRCFDNGPSVSCDRSIIRPFTFEMALPKEFWRAA